MWGHLFGGVGILAEKTGKRFCIPLALRVQDGIKTVRSWEKEEEQATSHVTETIRMAFEIGKRFGKSILLLDRLFLTVPALTTLAALNGDSPCLQIVTKAKSNCTAYDPPSAPTGRRGRPPKKGKAIKLFDLFETEKEVFQEAWVTLYGKSQKIRYHCVDLLWGQGLYQKLRFVLVKYNDTRAVLVSTDQQLHPLDIISLYGKRFGIETMFREMKQVAGAFGYRFWSKYTPRLNRYRKKTEPDPLIQVTNHHDRERIALAIKAIEGFVFCAAVATGLLQIIALRFSESNEFQHLRYLRTRRSAVISEATAADYLRRNFFRLLWNHPLLPLTRIISIKQSRSSDTSGLPLAS